MTDDNCAEQRAAAWSEAIRVGVDGIDAAHRELFALVAALCDKAAAGDRQLSGQDLDELERYAGRHFRDEEALMAASGYPDRQRHQASHARFLDRMREARERASQAAGDDFATLEFLSTWLVEHIQREDQQAADFYLERRPPAGWLTRMLGRRS